MGAAAGPQLSLLSSRWAAVEGIARLAVMLEVNEGGSVDRSRSWKRSHSTSRRASGVAVECDVVGRLAGVGWVWWGVVRVLSGNDKGWGLVVVAMRRADWDSS